ncbi:52 kDa repressor of the inhibitor of the protein kinase-like [Diabrotica virgifera virgifera]|uniref:HAT C-terminal dimerisation domain-containing protein n=2 Tax=Diabrotica virgifera virgifera TaxID=50390 RepID=A0ABM5L2D0_DIAVI|nr:52 kDa repressor of the inhibitor of the protein kinase-like [Diabrotica virgifera virgifera]
MKRQASIETFFTKRLNVSEPSEVNCAVSNDAASSVVATTSTDPFPVAEDRNQLGLLQVRANKYDIGHYCQINSTQSLTNEEKNSLLENVWKPPIGYKFPTISSSNHARSFQMKWLEEFKWLAYSEEKSGSFCKYCVIFSHSETVGKGDHQMSGALELLEPVSLSLLKIEEESSDSAPKAHALGSSITQFQFLVNTFVLSHMLSKTHNLSENLQKKNLDLTQAVKNVSNVLDLLSKERENADNNFKVLYSQIQERADKLKIKEEVPRICRLQTARNNVPYSTQEEYYRRAVYLPYLDDFCNSLKERFESHKETVASLQNILPEFCIKTDFCALEPAFNSYEEDLSHKEVVESEFMLWKERWSQEKYENLPKSAVSSLEKCDQDFFPNIYVLLKLLAVLPVSVATVERSFSSLRRLKTYLRNSTSENRLNGLALLSIHRDFAISNEEVLDKFASVPRNLDFVL